MLKKVLKKTAEWLGYSFYISKKAKKNSKYEAVYPNATYSPWLIDADFIKTYQKIKQFTLVDIYRCFELWDLIKEALFLEGILLEVGVWRGGTAALIAQRAKNLKIEDNVYLCDTFTGVVKTSEKDSRYFGGEHNDTSKEIVEELMYKLSLTNVIILEGIFPDETSITISGKRIRFCHIDVDVYDSAKDIFNWVWPRLVVNGIIVFDDFGFESCSGITHLVNELKNENDRVFIHNLNGHAIFIKTS